MKFLFLIALAACNPTLYVESPAPPGRTARMDANDGFWGVKSYRMELSTGVAIALTCDRGAPCEHMKVVSDNPAIAEVRPASLGVLKHMAGMYERQQQQQTAAGLVVVGKSTGTTTIHVSAEQGDREIHVTVIPVPGVPGDPTTVASGAR